MGCCKAEHKGTQRNKEENMQTFNNAEFLQWAKDKKLSFISQASWPEAIKLLPPDEVAMKIPANSASHANLYANTKKELFLAVVLSPDTVLVFKQLVSLK
jgi:hypothetical protein